ncbi:MAG: inverse autotransporter beta domain-containing protein [Verrucomicrobiaceae bacterium]|nr:inverse autotransporter beta domain-containing protein [Verrucomicrobiaceae bacterium]
MIALIVFAGLELGAQEAFSISSQVVSTESDTSLTVRGRYSWVDDRSIGGLDATLFQQLSADTMLLLNGSAALGDDDLAIYSGGLGLRTLVAGGDVMLGVNGFFDHLQTGEVSYNQLGAGIEAAAGRWFFNASGYFPLKDDLRVETVRRALGTETTRESRPIPGGTGITEIRRAVTQVTHTHTRALKSVEAELGFHLLQRGPITVDLAAGYYQAWVADLDIQGFKVRGQIGLGQHLFLGAEWRQNGEALGQEWRFDITAAYTFGRPSRPVGMSGHDLCRYAFNHYGADTPHTGASGPSGKSAKNVQPMLPPPPVPALPLIHPLLIGPIQRNAWPLLGEVSASHLSESISTRTFTRRHPSAIPQQVCKGGPPLIFD